MWIVSKIMPVPFILVPVAIEMVPVPIVLGPSRTIIPTGCSVDRVGEVDVQVVESEVRLIISSLLQAQRS